MDFISQVKLFLVYSVIEIVLAFHSLFPLSLAVCVCMFVRTSKFSSFLVSKMGDVIEETYKRKSFCTPA